MHVIKASGIFMACLVPSVVALGGPVETGGSGTCPSALGQFMIEGQSQRDKAPPTKVYYLADVEGGVPGNEAYSFTLTYDTGISSVNATIFTREGRPLFNRVGTTQYRCSAGALVSESDVADYAEGCAKKGHIVASISVADDGALRFQRDEKWEFGRACFRGPFQSHTTTTFKPYIR